MLNRVPEGGYRIAEGHQSGVKTEQLGVGGRGKVRIGIMGHQRFSGGRID